MAMRTNTFLTVVIAFMLNAVIYGTLVTIVLSIDALSPWWEFAVPAVIVLALVTTPFLARWLAPRIQRQKPLMPGND